MEVKVKWSPELMRIVLVILDLTVKYGVPAVKKLIELWGREEIEVSLEELEKRIAALPAPESFFLPPTV